MIDNFDWGSKIEGIALTAETDRKEYKVGDEILLTAIIKNFSDKSTDILTIGGRNYNFRLELFDEDGHPVPKTDQGIKSYERVSGAPITRSLHKLDPSEELPSSFVLNKYFEIKEPGMYNLIVMRGNWNSDKVFLVSNMARFRVVNK
jgi:hypothetical protein